MPVPTPPSEPAPPPEWYAGQIVTPARAAQIRAEREAYHEAQVARIRAEAERQVKRALERRHAPYAPPYAPERPYESPPPPERLHERLRRERDEARADADRLRSLLEAATRRADVAHGERDEGLRLAREATLRARGYLAEADRRLAEAQALRDAVARTKGQDDAHLKAMLWGPPGHEAHPNSPIIADTTLIEHRMTRHEDAHGAEVDVRLWAEATGETVERR